MSLTFAFDNTFAALPERFFSRQNASPVPAPKLIAFNTDLAGVLGLDPSATDDPELAELFSGNLLPVGADPLAQIYAGHQFGNWNPQLGDGRALLLGEVVGSDGQRRDVQLKGSGPTPYSRRGDGKAWLGPVLREYVVSEAMHALGIPTTRALAAVATGEDIYRESVLPGAVLTRVASSHIRVGTFQYFAAHGDIEGLAALAQHVIARHYPEAKTPLELLKAIVARQARLIARWMSVGFIHGVMNTDNSQVAGETIDYGPCAFMDRYQAEQVFSSIDRMGRYAYSQQPNIGVWNMAQFATSLIPLMEDREAAVEVFTEAINEFPALYQAEWLSLFRAKMGIGGDDPEDVSLISDFLQLMQDQNADFTNTFRALSAGKVRDQFLDPSAYDGFEPRWIARRSQSAAEMDAVNPAVIPRNHQVEAMITAAVDGDFAPFHALNAALSKPFDAPKDITLTYPPSESEVVQATFCGT